MMHKSETVPVGQSGYGIGVEMPKVSWYIIGGPIRPVVHGIGRAHVWTGHYQYASRTEQLVESVQQLIGIMETFRGGENPFP